LIGFFSCCVECFHLQICWWVLLLQLFECFMFANLLMGFIVVVILSLSWLQFFWWVLLLFLLFECLMFADLLMDFVVIVVLSVWCLQIYWWILLLFGVFYVCRFLDGFCCCCF
jgi:hypothetical protein